jgi:hypothetical protein
MDNWIENVRRTLTGDKQIKAIATKFDGVQFRSRLEAKWAAFFNLMGWKWEYEPFDLEGWIPDFLLLKGDLFPWSNILVEIKPYTCLDDFKKNGVMNKIKKAIKGTDYEKSNILLLGSTIIESGMIIDNGFEGNGEMNEEGHGIETVDYIIVGWEGHLDTDGKNIFDSLIENTSVKKIWKDAGNAVQWRK